MNSPWPRSSTFVDPEDKNHERFEEVQNIKVPLLAKDVQESGKTDITTMTIGEAVSAGIIDNQTLGYFIGRIYLFLSRSASTLRDCASVST